MNIEEQLNALMAPPAPAVEVVTLERATVETILTELEEKDPLRPAVVYLRGVLAAPKVELWAMHSVGPCEIYPALDKEHAEKMVRELIGLGEQMKADRIAKGESVECWTDWRAEVIPSPYEPAEHFELMAEEWKDNYESLYSDFKNLKAAHERVSNNRDMWKGQVERQAEALTAMRAERDELLEALKTTAVWRVAKTPKYVTDMIEGLVAKERQP